MTGTYIGYQEINFNEETLKLIGICDHIASSYEARGYSITVRQLYYQLVAKNYIPNNKKSYERISRTVSRGRLAGLISWTAVEDRNRNLMGLGFYNSVEEAVSRLETSYRVDMWANQRYRPEVWVEKAALESVIGQICSKLRVNFFAQRGYNSQSAQWEAGRRLSEYVKKGQTPIIIHLGDHDPSGLDMTEDNRTRLAMFAGVNVPVMRIALNIDQVYKYELVPNYAKESDSRYEEYKKEFGENCWELDALDPETIQDLIAKEIEGIKDQSLWDEMLEEETTDKRRLNEMINKGE